MELQLKGTNLLKRYKRALEGLTPGGSEFVDDPERCAATVRLIQDGMMRTLVSRTKEVHELQRLMEAMRQV